MHQFYQTPAVASVWIDALGVTHPGWPGAAQAVRIERHRHIKGRDSLEIACLVTSLSAAEADPDRLPRLNRAHWAIQNKLHHVPRCDVQRGSLPGPGRRPPTRNLAQSRPVPDPKTRPLHPPSPGKLPQRPRQSQQGRDRADSLNDPAPAPSYLDRLTAIIYKPISVGHPRRAYAQVAQSVEQRTENPRVGGSIPPLGTIKINDLADFSQFEIFVCGSFAGGDVDNPSQNNQFRPSPINLAYLICRLDESRQLGG